MSKLNTIRITDDDYNRGGYKYGRQQAQKVNYPPNPYYQPTQDNYSDKDYTQYTGNSALEDSFELDSQTQALLDYNSYMIQGFQDYMNKDPNGLIQSYRNALNSLESQSFSTLENLVAAKCNLGIAHFFNSEPKEAIQYIEEALNTLNVQQEKGQKSVFEKDFKKNIEFQNQEKQSLYLKCKCNLMIVKFSTNDESGYKEVLFDITNFLDRM